MAARPFLELTKLQNRILFEYVRKQGFAEGVQKLYQRLKRDIGDMQHPAMNTNGDVALNDDGEILEFTRPVPRFHGSTVPWFHGSTNGVTISAEIPN